MKLGVLKKLRTRVLRRRERCARELDREPIGLSNFNRPRLRGHLEALDTVVDDLDRLLKSAHDKWHDRKAR